MAHSPGGRRLGRLCPSGGASPQEPVHGHLRRKENRVAPRRESVRDPRPEGGA